MQLYAMLGKAIESNVFIPNEVKLQQHFDEWFLMSMILRGYHNFLASCLLQLGRSILVSASLTLSLCEVYNVLHPISCGNCQPLLVALCLERNSVEGNSTFRILLESCLTCVVHYTLLCSALLD